MSASIIGLGIHLCIKKSWGKASRKKDTANHCLEDCYIRHTLGDVSHLIPRL